jgi:sulfide:quinone oxidoreductase
MSALETQVLIAGGGVGGIECALALRASAEPGLRIDLLNATDRFTYRPWSVATPFAHGPAVEVDISEVAADQGFAFHEESVTGVDTDARRVMTTGGERSYDHLVLALGACPTPVVKGAFTFRGPQDAAALTDLLAEDHLPEGAAVAFVATASAVWSLPVYELALHTAWRAHRSGRSVRIAVVTAESDPLKDFGPQASRRISALLAERGVELYTGTSPELFDGSALFAPMAGTIPADIVVALPALVGRPVPGIPHDAAGFTPVDGHCRVAGLDRVFAIGDMTDRKLKQGGLAAQQAGVVAAVISGDSGPVPAYEPILRAMLSTGDGPVYLQYPYGDDQSPPHGIDAPWWPPDKIVSTHLGPYLATHGDLLVTPAGR